MGAVAVRLYLRGRVYWVTYTVDGKRYRESTGLRTERAAERRARSIVEARELGKVQREAGIVRRRSARVADAVEAWLTTVEAAVDAGARSAGYLKSLRSHARLYITPALGAVDVAELTRAQIVEWRDGLLDGRTSATVNRIFASLRSFLRWAVERDLIAASPAAGLKALRERPTARHRALTDVEVDAWKAALRQIPSAKRAPWRCAETIDWIDFLRETGLRHDEAADLTDAMVDMARRCIELPAAICKSGRARSIPMSAAAAEIVARRRRRRHGGRLQIFERVSRRKALESAWKATGLGGRAPTAHDLRHTAACRWVRAGWTLTEIQHALGHRSPTTTARYLHRYGRRHADLADRIDRLTHGVDDEE